MKRRIALAALTFGYTYTLTALGRVEEPVPDLHVGVAVLLGGALAYGSFRLMRGMTAPLQVGERDRAFAGLLLAFPALVALLAPLGVGYVLDHQRGVPPVDNDALSAGLLRDAAVAALGPDGATSSEQSSGGEDFAWYLDDVPGAMGRLGVWSGDGPCKDLHQPTFDLDERALPIGVRVLVHAALASLAA